MLKKGRDPHLMEVFHVLYNYPPEGAQKWSVTPNPSGTLTKRKAGGKVGEEAVLNAHDD